jgi:hypothetical protein
MYHKLAELYRKMDEQAEMDLLIKRAEERLKAIRKERKARRRLSQKRVYEVGGNLCATKKFVNRKAAIAYYKKLKNNECQPYLTFIGVGTVRTSLCRLEIKPDLTFFQKLGQGLPILIPRDREDDKAARVPSILTKRKRLMPVVPEHQRMLATYILGLVILGTLSYQSVAYELGGR